MSSRSTRVVFFAVFAIGTPLTGRYLSYCTFSRPERRIDGASHPARWAEALELVQRLNARTSLDPVEIGAGGLQRA